MPSLPFAVIPLSLGTITSGNETAAKPASHLGVFDAPGLTWRTSGGSNVWARGKFDRARRIDFMAMLQGTAHAGTTIRLRLGMSQAEVDGSAAYDSGAQTYISPALSREDGLYNSHLEIGTVQEALWWRVDLSGVPNDFEAAFLVLGQRLTPASWYAPGWSAGAEDLGEIDINRWGVADEQDGLIYRTMAFRFGWLSEADFETKFRPLVEKLGKRGVAFWCFDPAATAYRQAKSCFGRLRGALGAVHSRDTPSGIKYEMAFDVLCMLARGPEAELYADHVLALDFRRGVYRIGGTLGSDVTALAGYSYARAGAKGEIGTASVLSFAANTPGIVPGIGYWARPAFTNLLLHSQAFDNGVWSKDSQITLGANTGNTEPDGAGSADRATHDATTTLAHLAQTVTVPSAGAYTLSVFARHVSGNAWLRGAGVNFDVSPAAWFNASTGAVGTQQNGASGGSATAAGSSWYRFAFTFSPSADLSGTIRLSPALAADSSNTAGAGAVDLWQAQIVAGTRAGPVIETAGSTASVGADVLALTSPTFADEDFAIWMVVNHGAAPTASADWAEFSNAGSADDILLFNLNAGGGFRPTVKVGGVAQDSGGNASVSLGAGRGVMLIRRRAGKFTAATRFGGVNALGTEGAAASVPTTLNRINVGSGRVGGAQPNAIVESIKMMRGTFGDAQVAALMEAEV